MVRKLHLRAIGGRWTLQNDIESGKLNPGDKLDNENELKDRFNISRDTLRKALAKLEAEGYIKRKKSLENLEIFYIFQPPLT